MTTPAQATGFIDHQENEVLNRARLDGDEEYHEIDEIQSITTNLEDGHGSVQALSRPSSSGSEIFYDSSQLVHDMADVSSPCEVSQTTYTDVIAERSSKIISAPERVALEELHSGFKMGAAPIRTPVSGRKQSPPHMRGTRQDSGLVSLNNRNWLTSNTESLPTCSSSTLYTSSEVTDASQAQRTLGASTPLVPDATDHSAPGNAVVTSDINAENPKPAVKAPYIADSTPSEQADHPPQANVAVSRKGGNRSTSLPKSRRRRRPKRYTLDGLDDPLAFKELIGMQKDIAPRTYTTSPPPAQGASVGNPAHPLALEAEARELEQVTSPYPVCASNGPSQSYIREAYVDVLSLRSAVGPGQVAGDTTVEFDYPTTTSNKHVTEDVPLVSSGNADAEEAGLLDATDSNSGRQPYRAQASFTKTRTSPRRGRSQAEAILHTVSGRTGPARISKAAFKAGIHQVKLSLRKVYDPMKSLLSSENCRIFEEALQLIDAAGDELDQASQDNDDLSKQLDDAKSQNILSEDRRAELQTTAKRLKKFLNGIGNDMAAMRKSLPSKMPVVEDPLPATDRRGHLQLAMEVMKSRDEALTIARALMAEKQQLESQLGDKAGDLSEARDLAAVLRQQLAKQDNQQIQGLLQGLRDDLVCKLGTLAEVLSKGQRDNDLIEAVQKCSQNTESLVSNSRTASDNLEHIKSMLDTLASASQQYLEDNRHLKDEDHVARVQTHITGLIETLKRDLYSQEDLVTTSSSLRETIVKLEEQSKSSNAEVTSLTFKTVEAQLRESSLRERINQLESTNSALQNERSSAEYTRLQFEEATSERASMRQELVELTSSQSLHTSNLGSLTNKIESLEKEKHDLCSRLTQFELDASLVAVPDFEAERESLREEARRELAERTKSIKDLAKENQIRHVGELQKVAKEKVLAEKEFNSIATELDHMKSENQLLKEQSQNSDLQVEKLQIELVTVHSQLIESETARKSAEVRENGCREELEKTQSEVATLRQDAEEIDSIFTLPVVRGKSSKFQEPSSTSMSMSHMDSQPPSKPKRKVTHGQDSQDSRHSAIMDRSQSQIDALGDTSLFSDSSPISPDRSSWNKWQQISQEESRENLRQLETTSPRTGHQTRSPDDVLEDGLGRDHRRPARAMPHGKKRDPVVQDPQDTQDVYDIGNTPAKQGQKRKAGNAGTASTPRTSSSQRVGGSSQGSTAKNALGGSSSGRKSIMGRSASYAEPARKNRKSAKNSRIDDRFNQEGE